MSRYARHMTLPQVGEEGQKKLSHANVLIVGVGGLGSPCALTLTAAGVGTLGLVDGDRVSLSNLQRQTLYREDQIGEKKVSAAARNLRARNREIKIVEYPEALTKENALSVFEDYDLIVDGTDNFKARYLINDAAMRLKKWVVYGSIFQFDGQVSVFGPEAGCYRCLYPDPPDRVPNCAEAGVLGVLPSVVGNLQANEVLKILLGAGEPLFGKLLLFDALQSRLRMLKFDKNSECRGCTKIRETLEEIQVGCVFEADEVTPEDYVRVKDEESLLDVREPFERALASLGGEHIPLGRLSEDWKKLDTDREWVVYCHHGIRSQSAVSFLKAQGLKAKNLAGGIDRWSSEVDPELPRY